LIGSFNFTSFVHGQAVSSAASPAPATQPAGLDSLGDDALLAELAGRGLDDLLNRVFDIDHIPADRRAAITNIGALQRLSTDKSLTDSQREQLLNRAASGADLIAKTLGDNPQLLLKEGQIIAEQGADPQTGLLEFWGDNDAEKARLHPIAAAAVKLFDQAAQRATAQATDLANRITGPDDKIADVWRKTTDLASAATYQKARLQYALALSLDPADAARTPLIDESIKTLEQWDNGDSGIQPQVRLILAKLHSLKGGSDELAASRQLIDSLLNSSNPSNAPASQIVPAPSAALLSEARLYGVIVAIKAGDAAGAKAALALASADQKAHFVNDLDLQMAIRLLDYRIAALQADQTPAGPQRNAANAAAVNLLTQLLHDFPGLQKEIYRQLVMRVPAKQDLKQIDPLFLRAVVDQGLRQILSATPDQIQDKTTIAKALDASRELLARYDVKTLPPAQAIEPSLYIGFFQEYMGDKAGAVNSLLDHIQRFGNQPAAKATVALERAQALINDLRQATPVEPSGRTNPKIQALLDRFLPIAIAPPFNRHEFALQYALSLRAQQKWSEALKFYRMVPDTEPPIRRLSARYGEMVSIKGQLEETADLSAAQKQEMIGQIQKLADTVRGIANDLLKGSSAESEKNFARSTLASTSLAAADLTRRDQNDPQRVLDLLGGFEDSVRGLPDAKTLLNSALFLRVQAYMQLGKNNDATKTLVQYLDSTNGSEGASTVKDLLATLGDQLDKAAAVAQSAHEKHDAVAEQTAQSTVRQLSDNRAMLSGFLVKWAQQSTDPKIHALLYVYLRFDADNKRQAASTDTDPDSRQRGLVIARDLYKQLQSPQNIALYQATLDASANTDKNLPDPLVTLGQGLIAYDLHDCQTVKNTLGQLLRDQRLGDNSDEFWEATYKLLDCTHTLAKAGDKDSTLAQVQQAIKVQYLIWRDATGGKKWHEKFELLRKIVLPDWTPPPPASNPSAN
jgi:hypothetical protein